MKKLLLLLIVCSVSAHIMAQKTRAEKAVTTPQPASPVNDILPPPPPPAPPEAPLPPLPPPPPPPASDDEVTFTPPVIVNDKGYDISVHYNNGNNMVYMKRKGVTEKVSVEKWNANKSYYENKYGILPPPPPPPAPPANPSEN